MFGNIGALFWVPEEYSIKKIDKGPRSLPSNSLLQAY